MGEKWEELRQVSTAASWGMLVVLAMAILGWGFLNLALVKDRDREWDFGDLPDVPGESIYSSDKPPPGTTPQRQQPPLPETYTKPAEPKP